MARTRISAALLLCLAGGALSLILLSKHYGVPLLGEAALAACGEDGGCDIVSQSRYAVFLGLPLAAWGLLLYGSLFALLAPALYGRTEETADASPSLAFFLVALAVVIDVVLLGLQIFIIKAFCRFCLATYVVNLMTLAALWPFKQASQAINFLFTPRARGALVAWGVATLSVAAATVAGNAALQGRKAVASSSILGLPTLIAAPGRALEGSVEEQLTQARAEAKKWKDTLDDEKRLQQYLNQKAKDDFNNSSVAKLDLSRSPSQGAPNGPIVLATYSDFMCPFCRDLASALRNYLPLSGNRIRAHYKHYPLDMSCNVRIGQTVHPGACELALGGICAEESGRFWEYHDKVFAQRWDRATREDVLKIGASVGLEASRLSSCMDSATAKGRLAKDVEEGGRVGVESTPTVFINGRKLQSMGVFLLGIEEERKRLNLPPLSGTPIPKDN